MPTREAGYSPIVVTSADLTGDLDRLRDLPVNYDESTAPPRVTAGWHQDHWTVELGREEPGEPGALVRRAHTLVDGYEFTNPRQLRAIYRRDPQLVGRDMLLEGRFLRLRFLMGVRITEQHDGQRAGAHGPEHAIGWTYQTLAGHLEQGRLTYEVVKELDTGRVTFSIIAYSRQAPIRNPVVRIGFRLFGRANQVQFYRHAGRRLRALVASEPAPGGPGEPDGRVTHAPTGAAPGRAEWLSVSLLHPGR